MLSASAKPLFMAEQKGHENAERMYTVCLAWIKTLDGDQVEMLNNRIGIFSSVPIVPFAVKTAG